MTRRGATINGMEEGAGTEEVIEHDVAGCSMLMLSTGDRIRLVVVRTAMDKTRLTMG